MRKIFLFFVFALLLGIICFLLGRPPLVSVVMSTYNRADVLPTAILSVLKQTYQDFEFIIIDDGSTDETPEILKKFAERDHRIVVLTNKPNRGLIFSLNRGLKAARGRYIARMDDDDIMMPNRLEHQVRFMDVSPKTSILATGYYYKNRKRPEMDLIPVSCPIPSDHILLDLLFENILAHPTIMIRKSFLEDHHIQYDFRFKGAEDYDLYRQVIFNRGVISCFPKPLMIYARKGDNPFVFYIDQSKSARSIKNLLWSLFSDDPQKRDNLSKCDALKLVLDKNKSVQYVDQTLLESVIEEACPSAVQKPNSFFLLHTGWRDYIITDPQKKTFYRFASPLETGRIISFQDHILRIKWDRWGEEAFSCDSQQNCRLREDDHKEAVDESPFNLKDVEIYKAKNKIWEDYFVISKDHSRLYRQNHPRETARILSWSNNKLRIKWNHWGEELFLYDTASDVFIGQEGADDKKENQSSSQQQKASLTTGLDDESLSPKKANLYQAEHSHWKDFLVIHPTAKWVYRLFEPKEKGQVLYQKDDLLKIKWDRWGEERFVWDKIKKRYVRSKEQPAKNTAEEKVLTVKHRFWKDKLIVNLKKKKFHRKSNLQETGTVISFKDNILKVNWDLWGKETFVCDEEFNCSLQNDK